MRCLIENEHGGPAPTPLAEGVTGARVFTGDTSIGQYYGMLMANGKEYYTIPNFVTAEKVQLSSVGSTVSWCGRGDDRLQTGVSPSLVKRTKLYTIVSLNASGNSETKGAIGLAAISGLTHAAVSTNTDFSLTDPEEGATASANLYDSGGSTLFSFPAFRAERSIYFTIPVWFPVPEGKVRNFSLTFQNASKASLRFLIADGDTRHTVGYFMDDPTAYTFWQDGAFGICVRYDIPDAAWNSGSSTYESGLVSAEGSNANYLITLTWTIEDAPDDEEEEEEP